MSEQQTVFITGASSGIGRACALRLAEAGYRVYGSARKAPPIAASHDSHAGDKTDASSHPYSFFHIDVRDEKSVAEAVDFVASEAGRIDAVVNCAGISVGGSAEEMLIEEARDQLETNLLGIVRVCQAVLPVMRRQGFGKIINISSLAGLMGVPFQSIYSATKYAIEGFSESLQMEVAPYGIRIIVIEPGNTATEQTENRKMSAGGAGSSPYQPALARVIAEQERSEREGWPPVRVARVVEKIIRSRHPRFRYKPGPFIERISPAVRRIIPDRLFIKIVASFFGM